MSGGRLATVARYVLGAALLVWLLLMTDWSRTWALLVTVAPLTIAGVVALSVANAGPWVTMWWALLPDRSAVAPAGLLRADLVIKFVNGILPSRLAGRTFAPAVLRGFGGLDWPLSIAIAGAHTALYALFYGATCLVGLVVLGGRLGPGILVLLAVATAGYLFFGVAILLVGFRAEYVVPPLKRFGGWVGRVPVVGERLRSAAPGVDPLVDVSVTEFRSITSDPRKLAVYGAAWFLAVVVFPGLRFWLLLDALSAGPVAPLAIPLYLVTAYSVTVLPLTPGGVGVTEATTTLVFAALGFPPGAVVPAVFLDRLFGVYLPSLAGWYPASTADLSWG